MTNLMETAAAWLGVKLQGTSSRRIAGQIVTYRRGPLVSGDIVGWVSKSTDLITGGDEIFNTGTSDVDWSFMSSELVISGTAIVPRAGDRIEDATGNRYEVLALPGFPVSDADATNTILTVHTKRIYEA